MASWIRWVVIMVLIAAGTIVAALRLHRTLTLIEDSIVVSTQRADLRTMQAIDLAREAVLEMREMRKATVPLLNSTTSLMRETAAAVKGTRPIVAKTGMVLDSTARALDAAAGIPDRAAVVAEYVKKEAELSAEERKQVMLLAVEFLKNAVTVSHEVAQHAPAAIEAATATAQDVRKFTDEIADPKHRAWWHKLIFFWRSGK